MEHKEKKFAKLSSAVKNKISINKWLNLHTSSIFCVVRFDRIQ